MKRILRPTNQRGMILLVFIMTIPFLILIATYYMKLTLTSFQVARFDQLHTEAQLAADAGADYAIEQFNADNTWTGTGSEVTLHNDSSIKTTYAVTLITNSATSKTLAVTGRTYWPANKTPAARSVTVYVDLKPVTSGAFSVVSGEGGLIMSNNSKITGGNVVVNGNINLINNAQIGLSTNAVTVDVADQVCGLADSTYPRVCTAADNPAQPISINNNAHVYGTVKATNQTSTTGMSNPGLVAGSPAPQSLPTYNRAAQKAAVSTTINGNFSCNNGTQTWAANTKITGNATISGSCKVTANGDVWIVGNLSVGTNSQLIVANTLGATPPNIMVDGSGGVTLSNNSALTPNSSNTGFEIYTFWNITGNPDATVTGTNLYNSRATTTILMQNNSNAANTILYAYWSQVAMSNNGQIGALIGQTVNLSNNGTITFGTSVSTSSTTWVVQGYRRH